MNKLKIAFATAAALLGFFATRKSLAASEVQRPPIVGLAHVGLFVSDINKADVFYGHVLGFAHFSLDKPSGGLMLNYYKVNDHQYIEIYPGLKGDAQDRLSHVAFETTD